MGYFDELSDKEKISRLIRENQKLRNEIEFLRKKESENKRVKGILTARIYSSTSNIKEVEKGGDYGKRT